MRLTRISALVLAVALALTTATSAGEIRSKHLPFGLPTGTDATNDLVFRSCYVLSSNDKTKFADWVAYRLTLLEVHGEVKLDRNFRSDTLIDPDETLESSDYTGANAAFKYEKGHLAPLASFKGSPFAAEVNYLSNIVPQKSAMNGGPWGRLEEAVRKLVYKHRVVVVMCGTLYDIDVDELPKSDEMHEVPGAFWKVVITKPKGQPLKVAAFIMRQDIAGNANYTGTLTTVKEIQDRAGFKLFPKLPASLVNVKDAAWVGTWE